MLFYLVLGIHILLCVTLVSLVLIQQGKGADMGAAFGGGGSNTFFGAAGATAFITKLTTGIAIAFMVTSILLINLYTAHTRSASNGVFSSQDSVQKMLDSNKAATGSAEAPVAVAPAPAVPVQPAPAAEAPGVVPAPAPVK